MKIAGLSVAYHAKPLLQKNCDVVIKYSGLDIIIDFFEIIENNSNNLVLI
jgi:phosphoserine phosphatase